MPFTLSSATKNYISRDTGLTYDQLVSMDIAELTQVVEHKIGKKLKFKKNKDQRLAGRGSIYMELFRNLDFRMHKINRRVLK